MTERWARSAMSEAEILTQFNLAEERLWVLLQWWASISIGLIALAHVAAKKMNVVLLSLALILYICFSIALISLAINLALRMSASVSDLRAISANDLSAISRLLVDNWGSGSLARGIGLPAAAAGLFLGTLLYPVYRFRQMHSAKGDERP